MYGKIMLARNCPKFPAFYTHKYVYAFIQRREGLAVNVSASHAVGRGLAPRSSHTKDYHKMVQTASYLCLTCSS